MHRVRDLLYDLGQFFDIRHRLSDAVGRAFGFGNGDLAGGIERLGGSLQRLLAVLHLDQLPAAGLFERHRCGGQDVGCGKLGLLSGCGGLLHQRGLRCPIAQDQNGGGHFANLVFPPDAGHQDQQVALRNSGDDGGEAR